MTIDHLRQERLVFERIHGRLEKVIRFLALLEGDFEFVSV